VAWRSWRTLSCICGSSRVSWRWLVSLGFLAVSVPALAEPPPRLSFSDGSIPPPLEDLGRDLLGMSLVLEEAAPYFTGSWRSHYDILDQHLEYLASLLGDAPDAGPEAEATLRRTIAYGRDLASFNLSALLCERSPGAGSPLVKPHISNAHGTGVLDLLTELGRLSGLSRLAAFLRGGMSQGPGAGEAYWTVTATSAGGGPLALVVGTGTAAKTLALTEAEVWALVETRRLGQAAAMLHVALRELTPAQTARAQGLRGTNSANGGVSRPPGFVSTQQWNTTGNATRLRAAMEKKLGRKLPFSEEVHHIVPSTHREAERAREILDRFGIDINSVDNGVVLTQSQHVGHGLHTDKAIRAVVSRLQRAEESGQRTKIIEVLRDIAQQIQTRAFPP
jgi:hypothetical protein